VQLLLGRLYFRCWTKGRHILKVEPSEGSANGISTCVQGKFAWDFVNSPDRLTRPLIREGDKFREATWDEALALVAQRFAEIKAKDGPDALAFISSSKCTNEESYLMQKLARAVIGTNNMDNCSRYCQAPATTGLFRTVGYGGDSGSIRDIENAGLVLIIGSNTAEAHPVLATRVKQAHKLRGQKLVVADLRKHEMAERADLFFQPKPGTDLAWLSAITRYILDNGLEKKEFLAQWVNGLEDYKMPDGKARLFPLAMSLPTDPPTDPPDQEFDLHLNNGRILEHFHRLGWSLPEQPPPRIYRDQTRFVGTT
jgi:formate dehydrogenase major subunit